MTRERTSEVVLRVSDAALHRVLSELAPMQALSAPLRSPTGASGGGGAPEETATERAIDRGDLARARRVSPRLGALSPADRATIAWLTDRAHGALTLAEAGRLYAEAHGPVALRIATRAAVDAAGNAHQRAQKGGALRDRRPSPKLDGLRVALASAQAQSEAAQAQLAAWGVAAVSRAVAAWTAGGSAGEDAA